MVTEHYRQSSKVVGIYLNKKAADKIANDLLYDVGILRNVKCIELNVSTGEQTHGDIVEVTPPATAWFRRLFGIKD